MQPVASAISPIKKLALTTRWVSVMNALRSFRHPDHNARPLSKPSVSSKPLCRHSLTNGLGRSPSPLAQHHADPLADAAEQLIRDGVGPHRDFLHRQSLTP